jgi:hypothetical protein
VLRRVLFAFLLLGAPCLLARDRAVVVYPRERALFRRVFYTPHQRRLVASLQGAYDVAVHRQVATRDALFAIDVTGAKVLVLSAHGDPFAMYFGGMKKRTIDASDRARLARLFAKLAPDATIVLQSCHTGRGFAHVVKAVAGGRRVIAATGEIPWNGMRITSVAPFDVTITCRDGVRRDCTIRL